MGPRFVRLAVVLCVSVAPMVFGVSPAAAEVTFKPLSRPIAAYTSTTCVYDLSAIPDHKSVSKLLGCGKATFVRSVKKLSVPATWSAWGSPPATETSTPNVLSAESIPVDIFLRHPTTTAGLEAEPTVGTNATLVATFLDPAGNVIGQISHTFTANDRAVLFAARVTGTTIAEIVLGGHSLAFANLRVDLS